jgi:hypothetical protein
MHNSSSTFATTVFLQTTNSLGETTSFAPLEITTTIRSTKSDGEVVTFTQVISNPTVRSNNDSSGSSSK